MALAEALVELARPDPFCAKPDPLVALADALAKAVALAVPFWAKLDALVALVALAKAVALAVPFWAKAVALAEAFVELASPDPF